MKKIVFLATLVAAVAACSGHGGSTGPTCVETMPGMPMCMAVGALTVTPSVTPGH